MERTESAAPRLARSSSSPLALAPRLIHIATDGRARLTSLERDDDGAWIVRSRVRASRAVVVSRGFDLVDALEAHVDALADAGAIVRGGVR